MSGAIELFLLFGFLVFMAMLWGLKKRIQTATETTASALESQRLAIERRAPMATSNSPTYGHPNSPRQDG